MGRMKELYQELIEQGIEPSEENMNIAIAEKMEARKRKEEKEKKEKGGDSNGN